jgi:hypothetical protein
MAVPEPLARYRSREATVTPVDAGTAALLRRSAALPVGAQAFEQAEIGLYALTANVSQALREVFSLVHLGSRFDQLLVGDGFSTGLGQVSRVFSDLAAYVDVRGALIGVTGSGPSAGRAPRSPGGSTRMTTVTWPRWCVRPLPCSPAWTCWSRPWSAPAANWHLPPSTAHVSDRLPGVPTGPTEAELARAAQLLPAFDGWNLVSGQVTADGRLFRYGRPLEVVELVEALSRNVGGAGRNAIVLAATGGLEVARAVAGITSLPVVAARCGHRTCRRVS